MNCSGLICLDFDDVGGGEAIDSLKASVSKDPSVVCAFVSPSGEGLKVVIVSGAESVDEHKECWNAAKDVFTGYVDPQSSAKLDSAPSTLSGSRPLFSMGARCALAGRNKLSLFLKQARCALPAGPNKQQRLKYL